MALTLDIHARYLCRHAGACCENWAVPAEPRVVAIVETRQLRRKGYTGTLFLSNAAGHEGVTVARDRNNDCVFFDRHAGRLCVIHRDAGIEALPAACRHFPRKVLHDARGTLISLSHFCPTAAALLFTAGRLEAVDVGPPLQLPPPFEGLDATDTMPPLVRPGLLCDAAGYGAWEEMGVATLARTDLTWEEALDLIAAATEVVRRWPSRSIPLAELVHGAFAAAKVRDGADEGAQTRAIENVAALAAERAADMTPISRFEDQWRRNVGDSATLFDRPMKNYLAARLFAKWIAYQGRGLRSIVEWLRTCAAVVRHALLERAARSGLMPVESDFVEAVRTADLLLLHVLDSAAFAAHVAPMEGPDPR
jgi:Fe-S-cluster containining protein